MNSFFTRGAAVLRHSILSLVTGILFLGFFAGCGDGSRTMKIADINAQRNTFNFVDMKSGQKIAYKKLIYEGKEVVDTHCTSGIPSAVVFAFDRNTIVRSPGQVRINGGKGLTIHAKIKYKLEDGVLTILGTK